MRLNRLLLTKLALAAAFALSGSGSARAQFKVETPTACPAHEVLLQMARDGDSAAQLVVAKRYLRGTEADTKSAVQWLQRAAEQGNASAQTLLGTLYLEGKDTGKDPFKAGIWLLRAANQGNREARSRLGAMYIDGIGVPKDLAEASGWFYQSSSNEARIQIALKAAVSSVPYSAQGATMSEYQRYAEQGSSLAQYTLGRMYFDAPSGRRNEPMAVEWLTKAAQSGHVDAAIRLAGILAWGDGVDVDEKQALVWLHQAAKYDKKASAQEALQLSRRFDRGYGSADNAEKSLYWMTVAAELDNPMAQSQLARMHAMGKGTNVDTARALHWYQMAAEQDYPAAQYALAQIYLAGTGVPVDVGTAYFWWSLSTRKGYVGGELNSEGFWQKYQITDRSGLDQKVQRWVPNTSVEPSKTFQKLEAACS